MDLRYWAGATRALTRHLRSDPSFVKELARAGLLADAKPKAPTMAFLDAYPEAEGCEVSMGRVAFRRSNLDPLEQYILAALCTVRKPRRIFEIGTYDGATTLVLARNAPEAEIFTLDLPPVAATAARIPEEIANAQEGAGKRFAGASEADRITQLFGDSGTFDFSPWHGAVDLVLVDAGHDYDSVAADTASAVRMVSERGIIVWDDYDGGWPGVVQAVDEAGRSVMHVAGTGFALYDGSREVGAHQESVGSGERTIEQHGATGRRRER